MTYHTRYPTLLLLAAALGLAGCTTTQWEQDAIAIQKIDTHIHLYDTGRPGGVDWPPPSDKVLFRPLLPEHFDALSKAEGIAAAIVVEASSRVEDNQWVLDQVKHDPQRYVGVVGSLPIGTDAFANLLDRFSADPRYKGIRMRSRPGGDAFFEDAAVWRDLKLLADKGLCLDILLANFSLDEVTLVAKRFPHLKILVNHVTGLSITGRPAEASWTASVKRVAAQPNVFCKVSGIFERTGKMPAPKALSYYAPTFDVVYEAFGENRIIYGSNWPVSMRGGEYAEQFDIIHAFFAPKGARVTRKLYRENAVRFYGLD
ncbi:MAG: amidohydrolase family protein [Verrucomicrobiota bacterium]